MVASLLAGGAAEMATRLIGKLSRAQAADVLKEMEPDDATDVVEGMDRAGVDAILLRMATPEADLIRELLTYPPETAGGRMTPSFVAVSPDLSVDLALAALREVAARVETIYYAYVTDACGRLLGVLNLRDLVLAAPGTPAWPTTRQTGQRPLAVLASTGPTRSRRVQRARRDSARRRAFERWLYATPAIPSADHTSTRA